MSYFSVGVRYQCLHQLSGSLLWLFCSVVMVGNWKKG